MSTDSEQKILEEYVNIMEKNINSNIDPREDFIKYACGNFNLESYDQKHGEYPPNRYGDPYDRILENETINYPSLIKARNFYKSYENDVGKLLRNEGLKEFCGGFPAFNSDWDPNNFDWIKAAAILSAMNLNSVMSFSIKYSDDKKTVEVSAEIPDEDVELNAEELLGKIEVDSDKIAEIVNDVKMIRNKSQSQAPDSNEKELRDLLFDKFFEIAIGAPLGEEDEIEMDRYDISYIKGLLNIFSEVEPKSVANYIMCLAVYKHSEDNIFPHVHVLTTNYFASAIIAAAFSENWNSTEEAKREQIRQCFLNSFEKSKNNFKSEAKPNSFMADKVIAEYIGANFAQEIVDGEYENLEINPENFFENIMNITRFGATTSNKKYFSNKNEDEDMKYEIIQFIEELVNTSRKPMIFHFSGWELEKWREVVHCFGLDKTSSDYKVLSDAISVQMITFDIPENNKLVETCISTVKALKFAFTDYQDWLNDNQNMADQQGEVLKKLNLNNQQAFFVSFAQHYCENEREIALLTLSNSDEFAETFGISRTI